MVSFGGFDFGCRSAHEQNECEGLCGAHGHTHGVSPYSYDKAAYRAEELHCSVLLFGHTHISIVNNDGRVLAVNPGSPACPRGGRSPSFALLEIENGDVRTEIITM